ncbi:glycosyltransferase [Sphingomonas crusticola]|uniref:glycosyltransferase n=1 Tax=Sphingomonas crusticola TaxID=1697973 RepID=UPI000E2895F7|nr:nucleotide disphospho-sugar-binding domain-containing protein [Sphingomonas crusticola]
MEIVLCTLGTQGDISPFLALSRRLANKGCSVTLLTNENWGDAARSTGAAFVAIAPADDPQCGRDDHEFFLSNTLDSFRVSYDFVAGKVRHSRKLALVYRVNMLGMECAAEKFGLLNGRVALQPSVVRSYLRPPWPMTVLTKGRIGWIGSNIVVPAIYKGFEAASPYRKYTNAFRSSVGLAPISLFRPRDPVEDFVLMMCPEWFAMPQLDWPSNVHTIGFPFTDGGIRDEEIAGFIRANGPPVVFTPGTGVTETDRFFANAAAALECVQAPGIFLSQHIPPVHRRNPRILCKAFSDLGWLLPQSRALVHHGGIGTTAQALRAGIPQMVIPGRFDQPDNAMRVAMLGLGSAILSDRYSGEKWGELLLDTLRSGYVGEQCRRARRSMLGANAAADGVRLIETYICERFADAGKPGLPAQVSAYEAA